MPPFLLQQAGPQDLLYGCVGTDDGTLDPLIRPGAFVQIDPQQNKITKAVWSSEWAESSGLRSESPKFSRIPMQLLPLVGVHLECPPEKEQVSSFPF
jgi:hypothetical protein